MYSNDLVLSSKQQEMHARDSGFFFILRKKKSLLPNSQKKRSAFVGLFAVADTFCRSHWQLHFQLSVRWVLRTAFCETHCPSFSIGKKLVYITHTTLKLFCLFCFFLSYIVIIKLPFWETLQIILWFLGGNLIPCPFFFSTAMFFPSTEIRISESQPVCSQDFLVTKLWIRVPLKMWRRAVVFLTLLLLTWFLHNPRPHLNQHYKIQSSNFILW